MTPAPQAPWRSGRRAVVVLGAACLLAFAGCADSDAGGSEPAAGSTVSESAVATPLPSATPSAASPASRVTVAPVAMRIPDLDIDSTVEPVGTENRELQIPPQPWVVGWWRDGVGPGEGTGTVVLTAHLDSRKYGVGPFARAEELTGGEAMTLVDAAGVAHSYRVAAVASFKKTALPYEELFDQSSVERVVFVTCGGTYDKNNGGWDSNVVVTFEKA